MKLPMRAVGKSGKWQLTVIKYRYLLLNNIKTYFKLKNVLFLKFFFLNIYNCEKKPICLFYFKKKKILALLTFYKILVLVSGDKSS